MKKPRTDVYTIMLILSLLAIILGCVFLALEIKEYEGQPNGPAAMRPTDLSPQPFGYKLQAAGYWL